MTIATGICRSRKNAVRVATAESLPSRVVDSFKEFVALPSSRMLEGQKLTSRPLRIWTDEARSNWTRMLGMYRRFPRGFNVEKMSETMVKYYDLDAKKMPLEFKEMDSHEGGSGAGYRSSIRKAYVDRWKPKTFPWLKYGWMVVLAVAIVTSQRRTGQIRNNESNYLF